MGYSFKTLCKALGQPGVTIHNLLPAPTPAPDNAHLQKVGSGPFSMNDLPKHSSLTLACFLVRFIVADDCYRCLGPPTFFLTPALSTVPHPMGHDHEQQRNLFRDLGPVCRW